MEKILLTVLKDYRRIDKYISENLKHHSRSKIEKMIEIGNVLLNGKEIRKKNFAINKGDRVEITFAPPDESSPMNKEEYPLLKKLYEDDHIIIIDKPSGILVHPGSGKREVTILDLLINEYPEVKDIKDSERPGIVHRLDKGTSGVLILAKNFVSMKKLQKQFKRREIKKKYYGIVSGTVRFKNGTINSSLIKNPRDKRKFKTVSADDMEQTNARDSETVYSVLFQFNNSALMKFEPKTGRTHQIRVHMASIGNPILGDDIYGSGKSFKRLALHAAYIKFSHPVFENIEIRSFAPIPDSFKIFFKDNYHDS